MSLSPATFALPATFLGLAAYDRAATFCVAGIPLDVGTTNRSGARDGPAAIRRASRMLVDGAHPVHRIEPAMMPVADIGDFSIALGDIAKSLDLIERQAAAVGHLIALGGEHGITLPLLRALAKRTGPLALVHFDAHVDTWPDNFGQRYAHGSVFFHAIEEGLVDPRKTIQIGIRSPMGTDVYDWTLARGVRIVPAEAVHEMGPAAVAEEIRAVVGAAPTYLSVDVDVLDPAFAPGTGTPEIGGLASWQLLAVLRRLGDLDFRGMDVVEVAPAYDVAEITALAAATVAWEYLALMGTKAATA
ncbi:agmatinase [Rhodoplanes elegans]|uniref:Agmatinase n=1 Tax=Rhodoplanes elegans TaxID=29408 RepID=A0A327KRU8_9BRAD|nr:agmatinase [Rhodoplanes elegans]MBK5960257.1 agmatinase [Rhodoplanes elegans]RAI40706.1 agmatinase [Rhodoplanes elegans]